jgi:hypothetical protein
VNNRIGRSRLWSESYEKQLRFLQNAGRIKTAENDWTKIKKAVEDKLTAPVNPVDIATDKAKEKIKILLTEQLPRVAAFFELIAPVIGGAVVFFTESETATDFDELNLMNKDLQGRFFRKLDPYLASDWRARLQQLGRDVGPMLKQN